MCDVAVSQKKFCTGQNGIKIDDQFTEKYLSLYNQCLTNLTPPPARNVG